MSEQTSKQPAKKNRIAAVAIALLLVGALAIAVPLVWQGINYSIAARKAAEAEAQMAIPAADAYTPADYSAMETGVTPTYSTSEMEEAATPPNLLEELGIGGQPSSMLFGIAAASAESAQEPVSMQDALIRGAKALEDAVNGPYDSGAVTVALASGRKQVENAFFLLTGIQPVTDTEILPAFQNQKVVDGLTRGDKTISAAREMMYATLTDLEALLKQVEDQAAEIFQNGLQDIPARNRLLSQMRTLSSYFRMIALHLTEDDYKSSMAQHLALAGTGANAGAQGDTGNAGGNGGSLPTAPPSGGGDNASGGETPPEVKRSYLLEIPGISLKVAVYRSSTFNKMYQDMRVGAAMFPRAPEPDTIGNICISAHRTGTRDYFRNLNRLSPGDTVYLHTSHLGSFQYEVVEVSIIEANDWSVTGSTSYPALTLLSCQAFGGISNAQRIMVRAKLVAVANGQ